MEKSVYSEVTPDTRTKSNIVRTIRLRRQSQYKNCRGGESTKYGLRKKGTTCDTLRCNLWARTCETRRSANKMAITKMPYRSLKNTFPVSQIFNYFLTVNLCETHQIAAMCGYACSSVPENTFYYIKSHLSSSFLLSFFFLYSFCFRLSPFAFLLSSFCVCQCGSP